MSLPVFDSQYIRKHLDASICIDIMEDALKKEASGVTRQYLRTQVELPNTNILGLMPSWYGDCFGVKVISVYHTNGGSPYPSHQGQILLFSADHGQLLATVDATEVTKIRTGAVSALASRYLANPDSEKLAIIGCGAQGESHMLALCSEFDFSDIYLWDLHLESSQKLAKSAPKSVSVHVMDTIKEAVKDADIICTVTPSKEPILSADWIKPGAHINAVGACAPDARELDSRLVASSAFYCDHIESILHESGDFLFPFKEGLMTEDKILGTLGHILTGTIDTRYSPREVTIFKAVGMAVEDIAVAKYLFDERC